MRIDEIMMRDWVYDGENTQIPMKIEGIYDDGRVCLYIEDNYAYAWVDDIRPIPMTEEIAAKNGWELSTQNAKITIYGIKCDGYVIDVYFFPDGKFGVGGNGVYLRGCQYVHELQQELRRKGLFDLAKEIKV